MAGCNIYKFHLNNWDYRQEREADMIFLRRRDLIGSRDYCHEKNNYQQLIRCKTLAWMDENLD